MAQTDKTTAPAEGVQIANDDDEYMTLNGFYKFENKNDTFKGVALGFIPNPKYDPKVEGEGRGIKGQFLFLSDRGFERINYSAQLAPLFLIPSGIKTRIIFTGKKTVGVRSINQFDIQFARSQQPDIEAARLAHRGRGPLLPMIEAIDSDDTTTFIEATTEADADPDSEGDPFADE